MTYNEALEEKAEYGDRITEKGYEFLVLIAPSRTRELVRFLSDFDENNYSDEDCKKYCTSEDYQTYLQMTKESFLQARNKY